MKKNIFNIILGNTIYALAVVLFILPNGLITGGTTGIALFLNHTINIPISLFVSLFNLVMFLLGAYVLGKNFAFTSLISTFYYPIILTLFQSIIPNKPITEDTLLAAIFAGILIGVGIGIVIKSGASTGGMDIPPLVFNRKWNIPISISLYGFDVCILLLQVFYTEKENVLYGILLVILYTVVLDKVLVLGKSQTQLKIISEKYDKINEVISKEFDRGSTLLNGETGYQHKEVEVILTVISNRELVKMTQLVQEIDPKAFIIINRINEVRGRGFTSNKLYL